MSLIAVLLIGVSVSIDAFAVSVGGALCDRTGRRMRNAAWAALFFGGFQFIMPLFGFLAASLLASLVDAWDHWLAFVLLTLVGGKMIYEGVRGDAGEDGNCPDCAGKADFFSPRKLLVPAIATSLDALAVGAGLKFAGSTILLPAVVMGISTGLFSIAGVLLGNKLGSLAGERVMTIIGGSAIILIGGKILLEHLEVF